MNELESQIASLDAIVLAEEVSRATHSPGPVNVVSCSSKPEHDVSLVSIPGTHQCGNPLHKEDEWRCYFCTIEPNGYRFLWGETNCPCCKPAKGHSCWHCE